MIVIRPWGIHDLTTARPAEVSIAASVRDALKAGA